MELDCALSSPRPCIPTLCSAGRVFSEDMEINWAEGPQLGKGRHFLAMASLAHPTSSFGETVSGEQNVLGVGWLGLQQASLIQRETCLAGGIRCHLRQAALPQFPLLL